MKKTLLIFILFFILNSCGKWEYVYKTNQKDFLLKDITNINVDGDDANQIHVLLRDILGENENNFPKYRLLVKSIKAETAEVINKDATASKFNIQFSISYILYNLYKNCNTFSKEIITLSSYSAKSAGYSFSTDLSQQESIAQNINKNIYRFVSSLNELSQIDSCNG